MNAQRKAVPRNRPTITCHDGAAAESLAMAIAQAGAILALHGALTTDYLNEELGDVIGERVAVEDWRRVAAAIEAIIDAKPQ